MQCMDHTGSPLKYADLIQVHFELNFGIKAAPINFAQSRVSINASGFAPLVTRQLLLHSASCIAIESGPQAKHLAVTL